MKNKSFVLVVLILSIFIYLPDAYAIGKNTDGKTCGQRGNSGDCISTYDVYGNTCEWSGASCNTLKADCSKKKHCTCYDANSCPTKDAYGNKCLTRLKTGDCIVEPPSSDSPVDGGVPTFLEDEDTTSCGKIKGIPKYIPFISSLTVTVLTIISMGMLVIMGTIDLFKGTVSGKDDEIKKNQKAFVGRLTSAIIIFLLVALTKLFIGLISNAMGSSSTNGIVDCINLFINNR